MSRDGNPYFASTFAERKAIREGTAPKTKAVKQVDAESEVEDKAVKPTKKTAAKKRS